VTANLRQYRYLHATATVKTSEMSDERFISVIGLGRVGLPLALCFADRGLRVLGVDHDPAILDSLRAGRMPFNEAGTQELLERVQQSGRLELADRAADAARADDIVITIGTPSFSHVESDLRQVRAAVDDLLPLLRPGHALILRSTIAPGTTEFVAGYLEKRRGLRVGEDVFVAHAPERIAAGKFLQEITTLPCIIGGVGESSTEHTAALFSVFGAPIVKTTPVQAELAKIWTNILRYATFALPNLLMMDCESYGANVFEVIDLINHDYPRGGIAMPGMTAGTCLRKDFAFSEERSHAPGMLLAVSRVNEGVPLFLVEGIKRRIGELSSRKVAVLGLTFKRDTDDERDSLSPKLIRLLERELADVAVCDPHAPTPTQPLGDAVRDADIVIVATNHSEFERPEALRQIHALAADDCLLVDPWNSLGTGQVFLFAAESAALLQRSASPDAAH
jgi:UDP-N-acetyl-D-mannosaminuronic acid dehydrogenase